MKKWEKCKINEHNTLIDALKIIDDSALQIALVVDEYDRLLGTVTDGDIRRAILRKQLLNESLNTVMNRKPTIAACDEDKHVTIAKMRQKQLQQIPVVDEDGIVRGLISLRDLAYSDTLDNPVVLMVGGLGVRLRPLTVNCPKPLLRIGEKPILETILDNFIETGFHNFYFAVNYRADMIKNYFGDGSKFGVSIKYLHEEKRLGTAGALSLLPDSLTKPVIVMNGDLLTKVNFRQMLDFHIEHDTVATMGVREYSYQIPYGVIQFEQGNIVGLQEKPINTAFVNAGIYVLNPECVKMITKDMYYDMPDLFNDIIKHKKPTVAFPIREYWLDIGQMSDFQKAQGDFAEVFK